MASHDDEAAITSRMSPATRPIDAQELDVPGRSSGPSPTRSLSAEPWTSTTFLPASTMTVCTSLRPTSHATTATIAPITTIQMVMVVSGPSEAVTTSLTTAFTLPSWRLPTMAAEARLMIT